MKICKNCKKLYEDGRDVCPICSSPLTEVEIRNINFVGEDNSDSKTEANNNSRSSHGTAKKEKLFLVAESLFLCLMTAIVFSNFFPAWGKVIAGLVGVILLFSQAFRYKPLFDIYNEVQDVSAYRDSVINECTQMKTDTKKYFDNMQNETIEECDRLRQQAEAEVVDMQNSMSELQDEIEQKRKNMTKDLNSEKLELEEYIALKQSEKRKLKDEIRELINQYNDEFVNIVTPYRFDDNITSEEFKDKLASVRIQINEYIKSDDCVLVSESETAQTKKSVINNNIKQLLRSFNSECQNIIANVTVSNIDTCRNKMQKSFEVLNRIYSTDNIAINIKLFELKLQELNLQYSYLKKKEIEKEEQKAIREQMLEEEKVRREIEREKARIEKEEHQFKNEISKLMKYLQKASDIEKQLYIDKIKELEEKLNLLEKDKANALQREQSTRAGYVYVISNIGSFGENVYKIGMTRRLEPMDRIRELGDASVPFEFDVHAMIFSEDAPALENILHQTFAKKAVNLVNPRKEFYRVSLSDIKDVVLKNHNATVTFTEIAKAEQYRESVRLAEETA